MSGNIVSKFSAKNEVGSFSPRISLQDLEVDRSYRIMAFKAITSPMYGRSVLVILQIPEKARDGLDTFECFLPRRFVSLFTDEEIREYNARQDLALIFRGIGKKREFLVELEERWA